MAFIRDKHEERTGYQSGSPLQPVYDNSCDFVMVYRLDSTMEERIKAHKEKGYVVHLMTGIAWGHYTEYLNGDYDGINHWDEAQTDRDGNMILHSKDVPYMCPTISFADFITEKLKLAVDAGVEAIHVEEPEFFDRGGYSKAFKREYEMYYREPWQAPHTSVDARYKCSKLKQYLYARTIDRVSSAIKDYAYRKGQKLRFYVPTHSLLNYTQWSIVSPEGKLADIPAVDGCIAQVWTGTSREKNWFDGVHAERTFETAYLEYGVMQELVKGTGRHMWFLHDPIEDNPVYDWNDYRKNYLATVTASLLHPLINTYEICPWPDRIFNKKYPSNSPDAEGISESYKTLLNNMFNTLGTIENTKQIGLRVGVLMGDCQLYQRQYPDSEFKEAFVQKTGTVLSDDECDIERFKNELVKGSDDRELMLKFMQSNGFPVFYGLALPLLKYGIPVRPVLLDNARRYTGYLDDYDVLLMSYEFMKPDYPDINTTISEWVQNGGKLIYVGNGFDPYNNIKSWWSGKYANPAEHLFERLGVVPSEEISYFDVGKGKAAIYNENPAKLCLSKENADKLREIFSTLCPEAEYKNHLKLIRDRYVIAAALSESFSDEPLKLCGNYADMYSENFDLMSAKTVKPGENTLLCDLDKLPENDIVGSSVRINSFDISGNSAKLSVYGADNFTASIRLKLSFVPSEAEIDGKPVLLSYDEKSKTALLRFESFPGDRNIFIS